MGRSAHCVASPNGRSISKMEQTPLHRIDECLSDQAFDAWVGEVVREVEDYLGKHAAFEAFLDGLE
jgi:hypothetical protein